MGCDANNGHANNSDTNNSDANNGDANNGDANNGDAKASLDGSQRMDNADNVRKKG